MNPLMRVNRPSRDDDTFNQLVRIHFHQRTVFARAGFGLVRVADHVFGLRRILRHKRPFHPRREAGAASSAQIRLFDFVDDLLRGHFLERFFQRLVSAKLQRDINLVGILDTPPLADQRRFQFVAFVERRR